MVEVGNTVRLTVHFHREALLPVMEMVVIIMIVFSRQAILLLDKRPELVRGLCGVVSLRIAGVNTMVMWLSLRLLTKMAVYGSQKVQEVFGIVTMAQVLH